MFIKSRTIIVLCLIKCLNSFEYPIDSEDADVTSSSRAKTELSPPATDNPSGLAGVCSMKYEDKQVRRVTLVHIKTKTYLAECCGGHKNCTRTKKLYSFSEDYKDVKPDIKYHQVCCKGYERDYAKPFLQDGNIKCDPVCKPPCYRGTCVSPNNCSCDEGFIINPIKYNECIEACSTKCDNATCVGYKLCECDFGFESVDGEYCKPVCPKGCINGECVLPSQCKCHPGYEINPDEPYRCNPVCTNGCGNGTCIGPDTCECPLRTTHSKAFKTCVPTCTRDCGKGKCVPPPKMCDCPDGYVYAKTNDTCIAICTQPCIGGVCVTPNNCVCFKDFAKRNKEFGCRERCDGKCGYGKCTVDEKGNQKCICDGKLYKRSSSSEGCVPRADNCVETGGEILAPWICKCPEGQKYKKPDAAQLKQGYMKPREKYCLPSDTVSVKWQKCLDSYKDVVIEP